MAENVSGMFMSWLDTESRLILYCQVNQIGSPDDAVLDERLHVRGALDFDGLSEAGHVDVQALDDAAAADAQSRAVRALVYARFLRRSLPSDQDHFGHVHRLPAHKHALTGQHTSKDPVDLNHICSEPRHVQHDTRTDCPKEF